MSDARPRLRGVSRKATVPTQGRGAGVAGGESSSYASELRIGLGVLSPIFFGCGMCSLVPISHTGFVVDCGKNMKFEQAPTAVPFNRYTRDENEDKAFAGRAESVVILPLRWSQWRSASSPKRSDRLQLTERFQSTTMLGHVRRRRLGISV